MKSYIVLLTLIFFLLSNFVFPQENPLLVKGKLTTDQRIRTLEPMTWSWNENRIELNLNKKFEDKGKFYSTLWIRNLGFSRINTLNQMNEKNQVLPVDVDMQEAYVEINQFIFKDLQLKAGRQKFNWGSGDRLNPVNVLNPADMEDIWDFGRVCGSDGLSLKYYLKDYKIEGIYLPFFRPAVLPAGDWIDAFVQIPDLPQGITLQSLQNEIILPDLNLKNSSAFGIRLSGHPYNIDLALHYANYHDALPLPDSNIITFAGGFNKININAYQQFLRLQMTGVSFSGEIFNLGIWGELAGFFPSEQIMMKTYFSTLVMDSLILEKKPWFKYLLGIDYTLPDGSYLNIQYLHGFLHEKGEKNLNDYFAFSWDKKLFNDKLKINPLAGSFVVSDWKNLRDNYALIVVPQISYFPNDNTEIGLGYRLIEGKGNSIFSSVKEKDEIFLKIQYSF